MSILESIKQNLHKLVDGKGRLLGYMKLDGHYCKVSFTGDDWFEYRPEVMVRFMTEDSSLLKGLNEPKIPDGVLCRRFVSIDRNSTPIFVGDEVKLSNYYSCDAQHGKVVYDDEAALVRIDVGTEEYVLLNPREVELIKAVERQAT